MNMRNRINLVTSALIVLGILSGQASAQTPTTLASFNGTNGSGPQGDLTLSGSTLFGMTWGGGMNNKGTIFSIPVGGGTVTTMFSFNGTNGEDPQGSLTLSGSTLFGMTCDGGVNFDGRLYTGYGTIFSIPVGGGTPTTMFQFTATNGAHPMGSLTLSGSTLYGMTGGGGAYWDGTAASSHGTIFSIPIGGGALTTLLSFNGANGSAPLGNLTFSPERL